MFKTISQRLENKVPISRKEAEWLYNSADMKTLSELSQIVRNYYHDSQTATYLIMAIINYTNVCVAACDYCSFYRFPHQKDTYLLSFEQICEKVEALQGLGGTLAGFNGGFHPKLRIHDYAQLFQKLHEKFPEMTFYEMTVAEFMYACKRSRMSYEEGAQFFKNHGTEWITGGGAEILDNGFRKRHSPGKYTVEDYYNAQASLLNAGLHSTATMVIGFDETPEERFNHLETLRNFQDAQTNKLPSFLCWTYKPYNNKLGGEELSTEEYLRWLAICRIYLHNFVNIRTSVLTKNEDALLGLKYGANDFDLPIEDEVTEKAGATISLNFDSILEAARKLGFDPQKRAAFSAETMDTHDEMRRKAI